MTDKLENKDRETMKNIQAKADSINKMQEKGSKVLVLQLGSYSIKMGFANQKTAFSIRPFIAYKKKNIDQNMEIEQDNRKSEDIDSEFFNKEYLQIQNYLKEECVISAETRPTKGKPRAKQVVQLRSYPELDDSQDILYSEQALVVEDLENEYTFRKPINHGQLNITNDSAKQLKQCLFDIENLLRYMLKVKLQIPEKEWKTFNCILVLPDVFIRAHVKNLISMIFNKIGFNKMYVHLQSILACLGTTTSSAIVVDIGHEHINVCCVDQGVILPKTLVRKNFGLKYISKVLIKLFNNRITEEDLQLSSLNQGDLGQVDQYKEACLALKEPEDVLNKFYEIKPIRGGKQITVPIQYGENLCIAGNSLFSKLWNAFPVPNQFHAAFDSFSQLYGQASDPDDYFEQYSGGGHFYEIEEDNPCYSKELIDPYQFTPLHLLVFASIMGIKDNDMRKKFLPSILVIGGGGCIPQLPDQLANRLTDLLHNEECEEKAQAIGDLIVRQIDPAHASWLGGTVLPKLDSLRDLWIQKYKFIGTMKQQIIDNDQEGGLDRKLFTRKEQSQEWGIKYLKEKIPFLW